MKKYNFTINGNKYNVKIQNVEDNIADIEVNGMTFKVELEKKMAAASTKTPKLVRLASSPSTESESSTVKTSSPTAPKGTGNVKSPLPGVILNIFVKEGDYVKIGQRLIVLEAMKMENNINADKEGYIKAVKVKQGDPVLEGDILIQIGA